MSIGFSFRLWSRVALVMFSLALVVGLTASRGHRPPRASAEFHGQVVAESGTAYVAYDDITNSWEIGSEGILRRMAFSPRTGLVASSLKNLLTNREWLAPNHSFTNDFRVTVEGQTLTSVMPDWTLAADPFTTNEGPNGALELVITLVRKPLAAHLHYVVFPSSSVIESWTEVENLGAVPLLGLELDSISLALHPSNDSLQLYWVQGLSAKPQDPNPNQQLPILRLRALNLNVGSSQELGATNRSTEDSMGWFALQDADAGEGVFGGLEWSGAWKLVFARTSSATQVQGGMTGFRHDLQPGERIAAPRRFLGFYRGDLDAAANASHEFARNFLMRPHPDNFPWTQFNTWYAYYTDLDEARLKSEVDVAAALGLEVFYVDAGWYQGSARFGDFGWGLGSWREDTAKFPSGLANLSAYVHSKGMKFGLWVEPERVDLRYVGPGREISLDWLAPEAADKMAQLADSPAVSLPSDTAKSEPPNINQTDELAITAQVCLGHPEARAWMKDWLARLVRDYDLDWLKWDYNIYMSCDPPGEPGDGNYQHILGLYEVLDYMANEFPNLIIENCASGGNRMDYGLMRRSHVAWLADETEPSYRVRYQMAGASYPFPPEYLNTWLIESASESLANTQDPATLAAWLQSRMMGAFGLSADTDAWTPDVAASVAAAVAEYKRVRAIVSHGEIYRLLPQSDLGAPEEGAAPEPPSLPDAVEFYNPRQGAGAVFLFQGAVPWNRRRVALKGLDPTQAYRVRQADGTALMRRTGEQLISQGIRFPFEATRPSALVYIEPIPLDTGTNPPLVP